jgi:pyridoxine 5-phosphate synthase
MQDNITNPKFLGINSDHIATIRNARGGTFPEILRSFEVIQQCKTKCHSIEFITIHLREDRRHIKDEDVSMLCAQDSIKINLEIACTEEMMEIAIKNKPYSVCIVPEKREEMTTESGLDIVNHKTKIANCIAILQKHNIKVSLFLEPEPLHIKIAHEINANTIEIHTGKYANLIGSMQNIELEKIKQSAQEIYKLKMECHAGHGINYKNIVNLAQIDEITLFNIGHFLIGEAIFIGLENAITKMHNIINKVNILQT